MPFDPISTVLAAALFAPAIQTGARYSESAYQARLGTTAPGTDRPVLAQTPTTSKLYEARTSHVLDLREALLRQLDNYASYPAGWDGPGSNAPTAASIEAAKVFLSAYPGGLKLPVPMLSPTGDVGFYWSGESGYADINFDADGVASFFSRSLDGVEHFVEGINARQLSRDWFFEALGEVCSPTAMAA